MKKRHLIIYLLLIFLYGCCKSHYKGQITFSTIERAVNPYSGNEVLKFIDNNNDTIKYYGQGRELSTEKRSDGGCADCCVDEYDVETDNTYFTSSFHSSGFGIHLYYAGQIPPATDKNPIIFFVWTKNAGQTNSLETNFYDFHVDYMKTDAIQQGYFRDSVTIRTKEFHDVYVAPGLCNTSDSLHVDTLFYTETLGLVGLKLSDGNLLVKE
jgi:hypothetical protein